jgi:hypothetical protein
VIIRAYGDLPLTYAPDIGEVVEARRTRVEPFTRAVVLFVKRRRDGALRVKLQWLDDLPDAGAWVESPIKAGEAGWVVAHQDPTEPPLIRQVSRGEPKN